MIDPDSFPFLNIFPFRTYFLFSLWGGGGRGASIKKETGEIFKVYGEKFDNNKILFLEMRESLGVCCTSAFFYCVLNRLKYIKNFFLGMRGSHGVCCTSAF